MSIATATGNKAAPLAERGDDLYETPIEAVRTLIALEDLPRVIYEPACGRGAIAAPLATAGHDVRCTDLVVRDYAVQAPFSADFLLSPAFDAGMLDGPEIGIVTNPPFKDAARFVRRALETGAPYVAMLMRVGFLAGGCGRSEASKARAYVLDRVPPRRVYVFMRRLPMMHRDGWTGPRASSAMDFAWFIWDRRDTARRRIGGAMHVRRVDWGDYPPAEGAP